MSGKKRVRLMDEETSTLITASYVVPDLVVAIQEAVYNAVDANARYIKVTVDVVQASFCVTDNGDGIHPDEMYEHIFENAATSKPAASARKYSGRGQFLMALSTLAKEVELESRIENHWTSSRKLVKHARIVFNAHAKTSRVTKGTRLRVENLFRLLRVRQLELASHASSRSRVAKRLSSFFHSLSLIWPTLSFDVSYADAKVPRLAIQGVDTCEARLRGVFGEILGREMEYVSFEAEHSPFTVRGYVAVIHDGGSGHAESFESPGWKQARTYYQFVFLDNTWMDDFQRDCCKTINMAAMELEIGIPIFVLKVSARSHEYELHSDGDTRVVNLRQPELLTHTLKGFAQILQTRILEAENYAKEIVTSSKGSVQRQIETELNAETQRLQSPVKESADAIQQLQAEKWHDDTRAITTDMDTQNDRDVDGYTDWEERVLPPNTGYYFENNSDDEQYYIEEGGYGDKVLALEDRLDNVEDAYEVQYVDSTVTNTYGYGQGPEVYEANGEPFNPVYRAERQFSAPRGCSHCACGNNRGFNDDDHLQILYDVDDDASYPTSASKYAATGGSYASQPEALASIYTSQPPYHEHELVAVEGDYGVPANPSASSTGARPTQLKRRLSELFFGTRFRHQLVSHTMQARAPSEAERKRESKFKEEVLTNRQSQWLSSRRLGRVVARESDHSVQRSIDRTVNNHENDKEGDAKTDLNAGSDQLSEYFSLEKLVKTHKQPTQSAIAHFASKRAALAGTLAPLPGEAASRVRVSQLPHDLYSASAKTMALDKSIFQNLQVIKQVDRKFILVKVTLSTPSGVAADAEQAENENVLLLCIDQHAADERVRLELLEAQVFGVSGNEQNVEMVEQQPPLPVSLNQAERESLALFHDEIRSWGFGLDTDEHTTWLTHTPKIDTRVAGAEDFREYLQLLSHSDAFVTRRVLRPPVITRFLHSRACRSAIMFGDYLSRSQCQDIVEQLSQCQLPFQCAHGRPSIVPLVELV